MTTKELEKIAKALSNERRLKILSFLKNRKMDVFQISNKLKLSFKSTSRHLSVLKSAELVDTEQIAVQVFYSIHKPIHPIVNKFLDFL